jgi:TPR repeat protein
MFIIKTLFDPVKASHSKRIIIIYPIIFLLFIFWASTFWAGSKMGKNNKSKEVMRLLKTGQTNEAINILQSLSEKGNVKAIYALGCIYFDGYGIKKDYKKAVKNFSLEAEKNNIEAMLMLGLIYETGGFGIKKNYKEALYWYNRASKLGSSEALNSLGLIYAEKISPKDPQKAFEYYLKAAEKGNSKAQYNLAVMYKEGNNIEKNREKAYYWHTKSAEQDSWRSQHNLACMYEENKNYKEAFKWIKKAAKHGIPRSEAFLASLYQLGKGCKKDSAKAEFWYQKAFSDGSLDAGNCLAYLWAKQGKDLGKAESLITDALKKEPENGNYIDTYGYVLYKQGKYKEALEQFKKANDLDNDDPEIMDHLADAYLKLGNKEEARKYWQKALELIKDNDNL